MRLRLPRPSGPRNYIYSIGPLCLRAPDDVPFDRSAVLRASFGAVKPFLKNKANLPDSNMNVNICYRRTYGKLACSAAL